jgi:hypothetical protein
MRSSDESQSGAQLELARRLLKLQQQLDAYEKLHQEELEEIRQSLVDHRQKLLKLILDRRPAAASDAELGDE